MRRVARICLLDPPLRTWNRPYQARFRRHILSSRLSTCIPARLVRVGGAQRLGPARHGRERLWRRHHGGLPEDRRGWRGEVHGRRYCCRWSRWWRCGRRRRQRGRWRPWRWGPPLRRSRLEESEPGRQIVDIPPRFAQRRVDQRGTAVQPGIDRAVRRRNARPQRVDAPGDESTCSKPRAGPGKRRYPCQMLLRMRRGAGQGSRCRSVALHSCLLLAARTHADPTSHAKPTRIVGARLRCGARWGTHGKGQLERDAGARRAS